VGGLVANLGSEHCAQVRRARQREPHVGHAELLELTTRVLHSLSHVGHQPREGHEALLGDTGQERCEVYTFWVDGSTVPGCR
jgi:hypothetical protein